MLEKIKNIFKINHQDVDSPQKHMLYCNSLVISIVSLLCLLFETVSIIFWFFSDYGAYRYFYLAGYIVCMVISLVIFIIFMALKNTLFNHMGLIRFCIHFYTFILLGYGFYVLILDHQIGSLLPSIIFFCIWICLVGGFVWKPLKAAISYSIILTIFVIVGSYISSAGIVSNVRDIFHPITSLNDIVNLYLLGNAVVLYCVSMVISSINYAVQKEEFENLQKIMVSNKQLALLNSELLQKSTIDPLTGLKNRSYLRDEFVEAMKKAYDKKQYLCTLVMDVDDFKHINDEFGHEAGDEALIALGSIIKDIAPNAYRYGGEEFFAFWITDSIENSKKTIIDIKDRINKISIVKYPDILLTVSIGLYFRIPTLSESYESFFIKADRAVYKAKDLGKNKIYQVVE